MKSRTKAYIIFFLISILAIIAGISIYFQQETKIKSEIYNQLTYISKIKREQISNWLSDRKNDSYRVTQNKWLIKDIEKWFRNKNDIQSKSRVLSWFLSLGNNNNYVDANLLNAKGEVEVSLYSNDYVNAIDKKYFDSAKTYRASVLADFHRSETNNKIHLGVISPLFDPDEPGKLIGTLMQIIDPARTLYPLIASWPNEARTPETLIVRVEGDSILYLNELRHKKDSAMSLKVALNDTVVPAVKAVKGFTGIIEGKDYRHVPVLAYVSKVEGTNWFMVSKQDIDEVLDPLNKSLLLIIFIVLAFIVISGITIAYLWKIQQSRYFKEKYALQKAAEEAAIKSLREKEVLLRELNHRTKNNMQIISSLISLQTNTLHDHNQIAALNDVKTKILAISLVHEKLQQTEDLSQINLKEYLSDLVAIIIRSFSFNPDKIELISKLEPVFVNIDTAISCGLILNELVSNAIKYAFPGNRKGYIKIELQECENNIIFSICDNGIGFKNSDQKEESLGLNLFRNIAEGQLMADIVITNNEGVSYTLSFENPIRKK